MDKIRGKVRIGLESKTNLSWLRGKPPDLKNSWPKTHGDRAFPSLGMARDIVSNPSDQEGGY